MRVAFAALKGGTGKTTSATFLTAGLAARGEDVMLIDAEPQGSALAWAERADSPWLTVALPTKTIHRQIDQLAGNRHVVIDTPPGDLGIVSSALRAVKTLVIPIQPTTADMDQLAETLALAEEVQALNDLRIMILLTRVIKNTKAQTQTRAALVDAGREVLDSEVFQSQAMALAYGQPVADLGPYDAVVSELIEKAG